MFPLELNIGFLFLDTILAPAGDRRPLTFLDARLDLAQALLGGTCARLDELCGICKGEPSEGSKICKKR
jgi:hypothetical protein